jgi:hypothetical protein
MTSADAARAVQILEETRPAGIRLLTNIDAPPSLVTSIPPNVRTDPLAAPPPEVVIENLYQSIVVRALILPTVPTMASADRAALQSKAHDAIAALVGDAGIGETIVYNKIVATVMAIDGVLDVSLELFPKLSTGGEPDGRMQNFTPPNTLRPKLDDADLIVEIASEIVAFDITLTIVLTDFARSTGNPTDNLADARADVTGLLQDRVGAIATITPSALLAQLPATDNYSVTTLTYTVHYLEAGLQVNDPDPTISLAELERPWVRSVTLTTTSG